MTPRRTPPSTCYPPFLSSFSPLLPLSSVIFHLPAVPLVHHIAPFPRWKIVSVLSEDREGLDTSRYPRYRAGNRPIVDPAGLFSPALGVSAFCLTVPFFLSLSLGQARESRWHSRAHARLLAHRCARIPLLSSCERPCRSLSRGNEFRNLPRYDQSHELSAVRLP